MKILYIKIFMHDKNNNALLNYKNINFTIIAHTNIDLIDITKFDCVYSPSQTIDVKKYPNTKFIFGPHFSVFPEKNQMDVIRRKNVIYIQPSEWAAEVWINNPLCQDIKVLPLPFGVDTEKFKDIKPICDRNKVFIYFKTRDPSLLNSIKIFLRTKGVDYVIFNYNTKYNEKEYINHIQNSKYGIWIGRHESQGFALEEALSCNVPLLVWNVKSMNEEYGYNYKDIPATTIPYWDERCGEYFYNLNELEVVFNKFILNINNYKPREYVLENLSFNVCEKKLIHLINNMDI
jgi:hypothetical protein